MEEIGGVGYLTNVGLEAMKNHKKNNFSRVVHKQDRGWNHWCGGNWESSVVINSKTMLWLVLSVDLSKTNLCIVPRICTLGPIMVTS